MSATSIDVAIPCASWADAVAGVEELCRRAVLAALGAVATRLKLLPVDRLEICVALTDDVAVHELNRRFRGKDRPTNVLSFPAFDDAAADLPPGDDPLSLGDVIVGFETTRAEAAAQRKTLADHLAHLVVHGTLHLVGYDHEDGDEAEEMEALERAVLAGLGIADPYAVLEDEAAG